MSDACNSSKNRPFLRPAIEVDMLVPRFVVVRFCFMRGDRRGMKLLCIV